MVALAVFAPFVFKWVGWILLGILAIAVIGIAIAMLRFKKMQRQMQEQMRQAGGGFAGGNPFGNMGGNAGAGNPFGNMGAATGGMTLEEFVKRMQAEADARQQQGGATQQPKREAKKSDVDSTDYVDFEEVK